LIAKLNAQLAKDGTVSTLTATCPLCGCPVTVTR
jgi:hypothetical protein